MRLLCALGLFLALLHVTSCLLIGAFNIQCFGHGKFKKPEAIKIITEIVQRYDIILIQEVRCNNDLSVPNDLLDLVNKGTTKFSYIVSEPLPLGPSSHKERYLFLYRDETVTKVESFQYPDTAGVFDRPPFVVKFSSTQTAVKEFVLIPIHTSPLTAAQADKKGKKSTVEENKNIMVLGDFNAGTNYVKDKKRNNKSDWDDIRLFTDKGFHWLIKDNVGTTTVDSIQVHDRIVVTTDMEKGVVPRSVGVFNFKNNYDLTQDQAEKVSNHFPVEVELELEPEVKPSKLNQNKDYSVGVFLEPMQQ